ncbi:Uncharacterised protein [Mycobacteroides abscessus subsp. abscessus]|nr:Uncharacterised protein [Mycobacteroides abscessus subsp. abscessus]
MPSPLGALSVRWGMVVLACCACQTSTLYAAQVAPAPAAVAVAAAPTSRRT